MIRRTFVLTVAKLNPVVTPSALSGHLVLVRKRAHCCRLYCVSLVNNLVLGRGVCFRRGKPVSSSVMELFMPILCFS